MKTIVAVDENWGIGYKGNLLMRIPEDMKYFKELTWGKTVIMGRETFISLPDMQPLKNRKNIVLSKDKNFKHGLLTICNSLEHLFKELENYDPNDVFIIGGESVYSQLLPYCTEALVTKIKKGFKADRYFPNLDVIPSWSIENTSGLKYFNGVAYEFVKYVNNNI